MTRFISQATIFSVSLLPYIAVAQIKEKNLQGLIAYFTSLINPVIGLMTALAVLLFVWGIVKYVAAQGNEQMKISGKNTMLYGIIGLFVLFSFWGIVQLLQRSIFG